jgi:hypothetical protein
MGIFQFATLVYQRVNFTASGHLGDHPRKHSTYDPREAEGRSWKTSVREPRRRSTFGTRWRNGLLKAPTSGNWWIKDESWKYWMVHMWLMDDSYVIDGWWMDYERMINGRFFLKMINEKTEWAVNSRESWLMESLLKAAWPVSVGSISQSLHWFWGCPPVVKLDNG